LETSIPQSIKSNWKPTLAGISERHLA